MILITVFVVEIIGRKLIFAMQFLSGGLFFMLLLSTPHEFIVKTGFLFIIRASKAGDFVVSFLYIGEVHRSRCWGTGGMHWRSGGPLAAISFHLHSSLPVERNRCQRSPSTVQSLHWRGVPNSL